MEEMREELSKMLEASGNVITDEIIAVSQKLDKLIVPEQKKKAGVA